jgi:glycosyltransferase involved in cell wall biosynthesis
MIYAASKSAKAHLKRLGIKKIELWNRGVDLNRFSPSFRRNDLKKSINAENLPLLLVVGRLVKYKDLEDIVDIDSLLSKKNLSYKWVFVGQGPMRKSLQKKLPDAHFTGFIHGNELSQWYASSDLLVFPSTTETFGNVILEAFASGIPVIVSNRGGVTENIQERINGIIAQAKSPEDFAEKIEFLLKNRDALKKMGGFARNTAENRSWQATNLALLKSYEKILSS